MSQRVIKRVTVEWPDGSGIEVWENVIADVVDNRPGPLSDPRQPNTSYTTIVLTEESKVLTVGWPLPTSKGSGRATL